MGDPLAWPLRVRVWDAALEAVRACLRGEGLREVSTPVRVDAVALEPWIEPITSEGQLLITSPELAMKQLLARGSGSIFQIAHVFRKAERGDRHREEFHLIEWYRVGEDAFASIIADVERLVGSVRRAVALALDRAEPPPLAWERRDLIELMSETLACELRGDEGPQQLEPLLVRVRALSGLGLPEHVQRPPAAPALASLLAWTELFSLWSDAIFDPWLAARGQGAGVHVVGFPAPLAALAEVDRSPSRASGARFESHVGGIELANGYRELRDAAEQRRRFELVAAMRDHYGQPSRPLPEAFIADVERMPACSGVALGLDRLVMLACGCTRIDQVVLDPLG